MDNLISWIATIATVVAASVTASNLGARITGYGFIIFTVGSIAWLAVGLSSGQPALVWTNGALTLLNLFGIWRWLGRAAKLEDGSSAAAKASRYTVGEALFPVSLLGRAKVRSGGSELGSCVDAMAGSESGQLVYVMVSDGGVAGAGEKLRRVPWSDLHVEGEEVCAGMDEKQFEALEPAQKDRWPSQ